MLPFLVAELNLCVTSKGELLPWIGPALRGLVAGRLKSMTCRITDAQGDHPEYCHGCQYLLDCPYGRLYEPDMRPGANDAFRPVVISPYYPAPSRVEPGDRLPVRLLLIGRTAIRTVPAVMGALADVGRKPGLGPDGITFHPEQLFLQEGCLSPKDLPCSVRGVPGVYPRVGIGLRTPLVLRRRNEEGDRETLTHPSFGDLFTVAKIVLCRAFAQENCELEANLEELQEAANAVECREDYFKPFQQPKWSSRTKQRFEVRGCVGGAAYKNVPAAFIPWLYWAGLFHVAGHRVAGAGSWRVILD